MTGQIFQLFIWVLFPLALTGERGFGVIPLVALAAFVGAGMASARLESQVRERPVPMLEWAQNWVVQFLIFLMPYVAFAILMTSVPEKFNWTVVWMVLAAVGVVLGLSLGGTLTLSRWIGLLRPASPRLQGIVDLAVQRMGVEPPAAYVLRWKMANALAFPFGRPVAVSEMALNMFTDEELVAICSHELAHLTEPRRIHFARLAAKFVWLPICLLGPLRGTLGNGGGFLAAVGAFLIAHLLARRMTLALEKRADSAGTAHQGEAGTYARALEKLYEINLLPAVTRSRLPTHPHLYDRLVAAGITPAYARPKPPSLWRAKIAVGFLLVGAFCCSLLWVGIMMSIQFPKRVSRDPAPAAMEPEKARPTSVSPASVETNGAGAALVKHGAQSVERGAGPDQKWVRVRMSPVGAHGVTRPA